MYAQMLGYPGDYGETAWEHYQETRWRTADGHPIRSWMSVVKSHCTRRAEYAATQEQIGAEMLPPTENEVTAFAITIGGTEKLAHEWYEIVSINNWHDVRGRPITNWKAHLKISVARSGCQKEEIGSARTNNVAMAKRPTNDSRSADSADSAQEARYIVSDGRDMRLSMATVSKKMGCQVTLLTPDGLAEARDDMAIAIVVETPVSGAIAARICHVLERRVTAGLGNKTALIAPVPLPDFGDKLVVIDGRIRQQIMNHLLDTLKEEKALA